MQFCFCDSTPKLTAEDFPDQAPVKELKTERRRVEAIADRAISEQHPLKASAERVQQQAAQLQERMEKLALQAEAASNNSGGGGGAGLLDTVYAGDGADSAAEKARETDRRDDEALRRGAELLAQAEARKASLAKEVAALRADLARQQREVDALEKEQTMALAATVAAGPAGSPSHAGRRAEASRETENLVGVAGMSETQLERCVQDEEALVKRNGDIRGWYEATVANVERLGGVRVSHRLLFGTAGGGGVEGMELMVDLGPGQIMEVTVSAVDGRLGSVQLCHAQGDAAGAGVSAAELEELRQTADALPTPQNLRMLVREALGRARCVAVMEEHVRLMRGRYVTTYTAPPREFTVTLNAGLVAGFRLHVDYPKVSRATVRPAVVLVVVLLFSSRKALLREGIHTCSVFLLLRKDNLCRRPSRDNLFLRRVLQENSSRGPWGDGPFWANRTGRRTHSLNTQNTSTVKICINRTFLKRGGCLLASEPSAGLKKMYPTRENTRTADNTASSTRESGVWHTLVLPP